MGARELDAPGHALEAPDGLKAVSMYLEEASVTGTETALLAAACADGRSEIRHAATEPHVVELCRFLAAMGAGIEGEGTSTIRVHGVSKRRGATHTLWGDYIDAGSWAVIGAITGGTVEIRGARAEDVEVARRRAAPARRAVHVRRRRGCWSSRRSSGPPGASRPASGPGSRATS